MSSSTALYSGNCRIGNWVEEKALEDNNVDTKDSYARAFGKRYSDTKSYTSTCQADFEHPSVNQYHFSEPKFGPREQKQNADALEEATRVVAANLAIEERAGQRRYMSSTNNSTFVAPTDEFRRREVTVGRSVMKTRSGVPIELRTTRELVPDEDDVPDEPVTVYSQRLVEGVVTASATTSQNRFNRNTGFTAEVSDGMKFHAEGMDRASNVANGPVHAMTMAAAGELSIQQLLGECRMHFVRDTFRVVLADELEALGPTVDGATVVRLLRKTKVSMNHREKQALGSFFDGRDTAEFAAELVGPAESKESAPPPAAGTITVFYSLKDGTGGECVVQAPPKMVLQLPHDEPAVRALLRKKMIVPAHIDDIVAH